MIQHFSLKLVTAKAQIYVRVMLEQAKVIELKNLERDKYFRILADVYADSQNVAEALIKNRFAVKYDGGNKALAWDTDTGRK